MATTGNIRCARCSMVVIDVFNVIMHELMKCQPISAPDLYKMIMKDKYFQRKLNSEEMHTVQTLVNDGFSKLDFSIIYKLAKYFRGLIPSPTRNWGSNPLPTEVDIGDDIERIRRKRNKFVHQIKADISEQEMNDFFLTSIEIGKRIDNYLNKADLDGHEQTIKHYQYCSMEPETTEKYLQALRKIESLEEKMTVHVCGKELHFYEGRSIAHVISTVQERLTVEGEHMAAVKLIFHNIKDEDEQIELLNKLGSENNLNTENIRFICATKECIAVFVFIRNTVLVNSTLLLSAVNVLIQKIVSSIGMVYFLEQDLSIVVVSAEEDMFEGRSNLSDDSVEDFDYKEPENNRNRVERYQGDRNSSTLILNLEMKNKLFQSTKLMQDHLESFLGNIVNKTNGRVFSHKEDEPFNVVLTVNDNGSSKGLRLCEVVDRNELRIVIIGKTDAGKSSTGNTILGKRLFNSEVCGSSITTKCQLGISTRFDRKIVVVDTPGLFNTEMTNEEVTKEIVKCIAMTAPGPHAILLTVSVSDGLPKEEQSSLKHFVDHFGDSIYNYLLVVFTRADELQTDINDYVKQCPQPLKEMLDLCDKRYIPYNNTLSGYRQELQVNDLIRRVDEIVHTNGGFCYTNEMYEDAKNTLQRHEENVKKRLKIEEQTKVDRLITEFNRRTILLNEQNEKLINEIKAMEYEQKNKKETNTEIKRKIGSTLQDNKRQTDQVETLANRITTKFSELPMLRSNVEDELRWHIEYKRHINEQILEKMKRENERLIQQVIKYSNEQQEALALRENSRKECENAEGIFSSVLNEMKAAASLIVETGKACSIM